MIDAQRTLGISSIYICMALQVPVNLPLKSIILLDPMEQIPSLILYPGSDGYSRAVKNRRSIKGRSPQGVATLAGNVAHGNYLWSLKFDLINNTDLEIFNTLASTQNRRLDYQDPLLPGTLPHIILVDMTRKVDPVPVASTSYQYVIGSEMLLYNGTFKTGYGIFKVKLNIDDAQYTNMQTSCRHSLVFDAEDLSVNTT